MVAYTHAAIFTPVSQKSSVFADHDVASVKWNEVNRWRDV